MGCVANISERHDTHPYLRKHNLHGRVLHLFESADIGLLRELRYRWRLTLLNMHLSFAKHILRDN